MRPSVTWRFLKDFDFTAGLSYENGTQGLKSVLGSASENYDWFGANVGLAHALTKRLRLRLDYRFTIRSSNLPDRDYTQDVVGLTASYQFQ